MTTENKEIIRYIIRWRGTCECKKGKEPKCDSAAKNKGKEVRFMLGTENKDWKTYINWWNRKR